MIDAHDLFVEEQLRITCARITEAVELAKREAGRADEARWLLACTARERDVASSTNSWAIARMDLSATEQRALWVLIAQELSPSARIGNAQAARDLHARQTLEEVQQNSRSIRLGEREHLARHHALKLHSFDQLCGCRSGARRRVFVRCFAIAASRLATPTGVHEIADHACEPRPERAILVRSLRLRDHPRLLRDVLGTSGILEELASEPAHPPHLDHQLLAGWLHPHINCRGRADRSHKSTARQRTAEKAPLATDRSCCSPIGAR